LKAGSTISIGSSTVQTLTSSVASFFSVEYSVVVLPEPVGPVTRMMPCGCSISSFQRREAECVERLVDRTRIEDPHHDLLAKRGGQRRQTHFNLATTAGHVVRPAGLDAAVLRTTALDHIHAA
jgi:hypothetical protein